MRRLSFLMAVLLSSTAFAAEISSTEGVLILTPPAAETQSMTAPVAPQAAKVPAAPVQAAAPVSGGMSLEMALAEAYRNNPDLQAARAALRAVDENYARAMSGYRPSVAASADYTHSDVEGDVISSSSDPKTMSLDIAQNLYSGGTTSANVAAADNQVKAQRALLVSTEQSVFLDVVTSYMDVMRDQQIVQLNMNNEKVLSNHLDASRQRFELGDITKTDVSQSESRLSAATAGRVRAEGNYRASRAAFEQVVGITPEGLQKPAQDILVPSSLDVAQADAMQNNPDILYARYASSFASESTRAIRGELLPKVDLTGGFGRTYDPSQISEDKVDSTVLGLRAVVPLYTAGGVDARVRQARQTEQQRRMEMRSSERFVNQSVVDAWAALEAARAEMSARAVQIGAAQLALDGVKVETDYGSRSTLDLLDAEQEYLDAQVSYVIAERNKVVAAYRLLSSVGDLTADKLKLNVALYDPDKNFQKVKNKWIGTGIDP